MPRASSILSLPATVALATLAPANELPVIINGTPGVAAKGQPSAPPPAAKSQLPVIINYPSAVLQTAPVATNGKLPVIVADTAGPRPANPVPVRVAVAYTFPVSAEYMAPVAYNAYGIGPMLGVD